MPENINEALSTDKGTQWEKAIDSELATLRKHGTGKAVPKRGNMSPLPTKIIFFRKLGGNGDVVRNKARLVVRDFMQSEVEDNTAPGIDFSTVRVCLTLAIQRGLFFHQIHVRTAFLHGDIDKAVCICSPPGLKLCRSDQILRLCKGLYELKQSPGLWHEKWLAIMNSMRFCRLGSDSCAFRSHRTWMLL